jgi:hypothetical protein
LQSADRSQKIIHTTGRYRDSAASLDSASSTLKWATYTNVFPSADQHWSKLFVAVWPTTALGIESG